MGGGGGVRDGTAAITALDALVPHLHARFDEHRGTRGEGEAVGKPLLLLSALTIHNVPEGLAVGVAFAAGGARLGVPIALAIGVQNVPEGFAVGAPLVERGQGKAVALAAATGLVEPPAAAIALAAFGVTSALLPAGLAFAAGAMIYVVVDELIPESHARGHERVATLAAAIGFVVMMVLDNAFG